MHEESVRGTISEVLAHFMENEPRGEFVIVVAGRDEADLQKDKLQTEQSSESGKEKHFSKYRNKQL
jgi:16S rRNA (cytidine1402-2'-O)-methyltransferase